MIQRVLNFLKTRRKIITLNKKHGCDIDMWVELDASTTFEGCNKVGGHNGFSECEIGYLTYVAHNTILHKVKVGRFCSIADHVSILFGNHPTVNMVSTNQAFYFKEGVCGKSYVSHLEKDLFGWEEMYPYADKENERHVVIGNDVWIGKDVKIKSGVTIGDGCIIGAYSLVTKDVPPYAIVGGIPAKVIRYRFLQEEIDWLLKLKWWDRDEAWREKYGEYFYDIKILREKVEEA